MRFVHWVYDDAGSLLLDAGSEVPLIVLGAAPSLGGMSLLDAPLSAATQESVVTQEEARDPWEAYLKGTNLLGDRRMLPVMAGIFVISLAVEDAHFQDAAFTSFQSVLYTRLITGALKEAAGRARPKGGAGPYQIVPFSGHRSFPSGHATTAFAALTPWVLYYPNAATYGLFVLGAGTAIARVAFDWHWPTDVLAGAAIGFFTARYLTRRHQATIAGGGRDHCDVALGGLAGMGLGLHARLDLAQKRGGRSSDGAMHFALGPALEPGGLGLRLQVRVD